MVTPAVVPQGRPTVNPGTVPGSRCGGLVVVVACRVEDVAAGLDVETVGAIVVEDAAARSAGFPLAVSPSRVTRYTANPRTKPAATIMIT
jgi:hypothetical protein